MKLREIVYMILDELKLFSDDATYTEDHIKFLAGKHRALLLEQLQKDSSNIISQSNYQTLCLDVEPYEDSPNSPIPGENYTECPWGYNFNAVPGTDNVIFLRSTEKIPSMIGSFTPRISNGSYYISNIVYITPERMRFVGFNKYLYNIIYCSLNPDGYLYFTCNNRNYELLQHIQISGIFEDYELAADLSCNASEIDDPLDADFPIDPSLVPQLIQNVMKELLGAIYRPKDPANNANDDLADLATFLRQNTKSKLAKQITDDDD